MELGNLKSIPTAELVEARDRLQDEIAGRVAAARQTFVADLQEFARQKGVNLSEFVEFKRGQRASKRKAPQPKYRDPEHPENTWSGRGKMAGWLQDKIDEGAALEDFEISYGDRPEKGSVARIANCPVSTPE